MLGIGCLVILVTKLSFQSDRIRLQIECRRDCGERKELSPPPIKSLLFLSVCHLFSSLVKIYPHLNLLPPLPQETPWFCENFVVFGCDPKSLCSYDGVTLRLLSNNSIFSSTSKEFLCTKDNTFLVRETAIAAYRPLQALTPAPTVLPTGVNVGSFLTVNGIVSGNGSLAYLHNSLFWLDGYQFSSLMNGSEIRLHKCAPLLIDWLWSID